MVSFQKPLGLFFSSFVISSKNFSKLSHHTNSCSVKIEMILFPDERNAEILKTLKIIKNLC